MLYYNLNIKSEPANDKQHQMVKQVSCFNAHLWFISRSRLICSIHSRSRIIFTDDHEETEDDARDDGENQKLSNRGRFIRLRGRCNNCPTCVCMFFSRYDMHSAAYKNLYQAYKLALTLIVTKEHFAKEHFQNLNCSKHDYETRYRHII